MRGCRCGTQASAGSTATRPPRPYSLSLLPQRRRRPLQRTGTRRHWPPPCGCMPGGRAGWLVALVGFIAILCLLCTAPRCVPSRRRPARRSRPSAKSRDPATALSCRRTCASTRRWVGRRASPNRRLREVARQLNAAGCSPAELAAALDCLERECYAIVPPATSGGRGGRRRLRPPACVIERSSRALSRAS